MSKKFFWIVLSMLFLSFTAGSVFAAPPIKIGALFSVSGPASFLGEPERNTAKMMVDEINKAGGIKGRKLELIVIDTQGDATKAVQGANKLIKNDKVVAIIGPSITGDTMAVIPVVERAQIPLISCAAGVKITEPVKRWVFKTAQNDALAVLRIFDYMKKQKISRIAILTVSDGFGSSGREQLVAKAKSFGIQIVSNETYGPKDTDMTAQLTKIRASNAQAIVCWGTNPGPAVVARNAKQ
ncbi:MAG TPA: ABC transporter substrate-binding protein, partial [Smithellaceae bacterium]|nr:ABC transporter substrate-binding protein [Smithellaceae bacterium]